MKEYYATLVLFFAIYIFVDNNKKLQSKILSCINDNKKFESNKHNFFVKKYLGDVKNAPRNMRKFLGN